MLEQSVNFRKIFGEKQKEGNILFQTGRAVRINELPFLKHHDSAKGQMVMASYSQMEVKGESFVT